MTEQTTNPSVDAEQAEPLVTQHMRAGLELLWKAAKYAANASLDRWSFAVELAEVCRTGLTTTDLRWLIAHVHCQHAHEIDAETHETRRFQDGHRFRFSVDSCFVLTDLGIAFVRIAVLEPLRAATAGTEYLSDPALTDSARQGRVISNGGNRKPYSPRWDSLRRELWVGNELVKWFRVPAPRQEIILTVFEEENWPTRIDDPLPPQPAIDPKRQLHSVISSLNRHQKQPLLHFSGDGTGTGVLWKLGSNCVASG